MEDVERSGGGVLSMMLEMAVPGRDSRARCRDHGGTTNHIGRNR